MYVSRAIQFYRSSTVAYTYVHMIIYTVQFLANHGFLIAIACTLKTFSLYTITSISRKNTHNYVTNVHIVYMQTNLSWLPFILSHYTTIHNNTVIQLASYVYIFYNCDQA